MKTDFIHIGYHKTASTWFQLVGLPAHTGIAMYNDSRTPLDRYFMQHFVEPDDLVFDRQSFESGFIDVLRSNLGPVSGTITGICEESLSGHYWNGCGQYQLARRVREVFGDTRIIITIRHQHDMLVSLYANYVKTGGTKSLVALMTDDNMFGERVFDKLCYDRLVRHYVQLFGRENVFVMCFEDFARNPGSVFNNMLDFVGAGCLELPASEGARRVNVRYSVPSEWLLRLMSFIGLRSRLADKLLVYMDSYLFMGRVKRNRDSVLRLVSPEIQESWRKSNRQLAADMSMDLQRHNYPL